MEISQENIEKVVSVLRAKKFDESLLHVQDLSKLAEQLIIENPDLTPDEIGELWEQQLSQEEKNNEDGPSIED